MVQPKVNGSRLKEALNRFGSLEKAIEGLQEEKSALEKTNTELKKENSQLKLMRDKLLLEMNETDKKLNDSKNELTSLVSKINERKRQYQLFEGFLSMLADSPSVATAVESIVALFQKLQSSGWYLSGKPDELRTLFVRTTLGDYLRCFSCDYCGAKFIVNKDPHWKYQSDRYLCPSCYDHRVRADNSFLKAMVTSEQLERTRLAEDLEKENKILRPLRAFLDVTCQICHEPITEWTETNVKVAISGYGWGHVKCWNSPAGQFLIMAKNWPEMLGK